MKLSFVITTFEGRFEKYFKKLLTCLVNQNINNYEIFVIVNAENKLGMNDAYRKAMLSYCAQFSNVYVVMFTEFRGVAKLWNTGIVNSSGEYIAVLNDDIDVPDTFISCITNYIDTQDSSFSINGSFSHFVVKRSEVDTVGYFDERFLGLGEEDGDFVWRYLSIYGKFISVRIPNLTNYVDQTKPQNVKNYNNCKYSDFNQKFMWSQKYVDDPNGNICGMFGKPMKCIDIPVNQYPYELYFQKNKCNL